MPEAQPQKLGTLTRRQVLIGAGLLLARALTGCGPSTAEWTPVPNLLPTHLQTPEPGSVTSLALSNYLKQLLAEPMLVAPSFSMPGNTPVHTVLAPKTGEVPLDQIDLKYMATVGTLFEHLPEMQYSGYKMLFSRPQKHTIIFINRTADVPGFILDRGEATLTTISKETGATQHFSVIALNGPQKTLDPRLSLYWSIAQAMCLGYSQDMLNSDPICNVIAVNTACGWLGIDENGSWINSAGMTTIDSSSTGSSGVVENVRYQSIPQIWRFMNERNAKP